MHYGIRDHDEKHHRQCLDYVDTEKQMDERFWNHLRVQRNILDFLYTLWLDDDRTLVDEFSTIIKDLVEYDFILAESIMKERMQSA